MSADDTATIAARAVRLKKARLMSGLNTEELAQKTGFSRASISYWENAAHSGLSQKGAERIAKVINEHGVKCDVPWLLWGIGDMPTWIAENQSHVPHSSLPHALETSKTTSGNDQYQKEMELFTTLYDRTVILQVNHNLMQPLYEPGDWVGGTWEPINEQIIGKSCIVAVGNNLEIRIVKKGTCPNKYNLCFTTYSENASEPFELRDFPVSEAAPIIRVWRRKEYHKETD